MKATGIFAVCLTLGMGLSSSNSLSQPVSKPNVLFITVDDMNDWTSVFNKNNPIKTPNIEKLAGRGAFFTKAYCSSPACNPSRASVMTGTRPHKTGIYGNASDWRKTLPKTKTIQKYFKDNGYFVCGSGKIFHHHDDWAFHDNASFHEYLMMSINEPYPEEKLNGLNVGIYKPHSPFFAPLEYFKHYPLSDLKMPEILENDWDDLPEGARSLMENSKWFWEGMIKALEEDPSAWKDYVQAYQACASFADYMTMILIQMNGITWQRRASINHLLRD